MPQNEPIVRYHIQRDGVFMGYDKEDKDDPVLWLDFSHPDDAYLCSWCSLVEALLFRRGQDIIRISVDGRLV